MGVGLSEEEKCSPGVKRILAELTYENDENDDDDEANDGEYHDDAPDDDEDMSTVSQCSVPNEELQL